MFDQSPPLVVADPALHVELRMLVDTVMTVERAEFPHTPQAQQPTDDMLLLGRDSHLIAGFMGEFTIDTEAAYTRLDSALEERNLLPVFRVRQGKPVIYIAQGRTKPITGGERLALGLFIATVLSVLFVGTIQAINAELPSTDPLLASRLARSINENLLNVIPELWRGFPYAFSILLILGAHEMGHYIMSRRHNTAASLPYFLPFPVGLFGTFGAAIRLREPMRNRRVLLDIGVAGPIAGLIFAVPILFVGLMTAEIGPLGPGIIEGNSIFYAFSKFLVFGEFLPSATQDVYLNQFAWAGWTGLFVTGLNLIPLGQLDGGHVTYSLLGKTARRLYYPALIALGALTVLTDGALALMLILLIFLGRYHAVPLDDVTKLDPARVRVALLALVIFVLVFVPIPVEVRAEVAQGRRIIPGTTTGITTTLAIVLAMGLRWRRDVWRRRP